MDSEQQGAVPGDPGQIRKKMAIPSLNELLFEFRKHGAHQVFCKPLAENDNSKQQVYLGGGFSAINVLPFDKVTETSGGKTPTMKAALRLSWMDGGGRIAPAPGAQLILYPKYPEVRLSGFLRGCSTAPAETMRPIPAARRRFNNESDGRLLFFAVTSSREVIAYLAEAESAIAKDFASRDRAVPFVHRGKFLEVPLDGDSNTKEQLLVALRAIHMKGWHPSVRMHVDGEVRAYRAKNGGGYTLEALLGIVPNARAAPDFLGWEVKAHSSTRITLMTPEPDRGFYRDHGVAAFVKKFGHSTATEGQMYFAGVHKVGESCAKTGLELRLRGFSVGKGTLDPTGGIELVTPAGEEVAGWSFAALIEHWSRKHAAAAYVPFMRNPDSNAPGYRYKSPVALGEGTGFGLFLSAMAAGHVLFDPGSKIDGLHTRSTRVKARSQFRIGSGDLAMLYESFTKEPIS